ncbi:PadR family transcriptional regulator [Fructilactobacillus cliffordii]|uniref:PadR family transcriptional regulator n=1 Tax=Fructilactobacillus cliffordii TaxID=2940299 RepID=A0A9Q9E2M5_9LACO|nr:PadR family transcriptional regulator [Fructilactobacillus cliffordii]USS89945.1 PadR family transcriptional regulator [Fructilactobacillus cliffordii]
MAIQISSEVLEGIVLALLSQEDYYGYALTQGVKKFIPISNSTLYPILRRLKKEEWVTTYDQPFDGRNRRYYQITAAGIAQLEKVKADWNHHKQIVDQVFNNQMPKEDDE